MNTIIALSLLVSFLNNSNANAAPAVKKQTQANTQARKVAHLASERKEARVNQAKELLGKYYKKSVVRVTENVDDVRSYIEREVKANLPSQSKKLAKQTIDKIINQSRLRDLDPLFILAIIMRESTMNPEAIGGVGEIGLMQIRPETAEWIAKKYKIEWKGAESLKIPAVNITIGAAYLDYLREKFDNHSRLYISAYNMGPSNVKYALSRSVWPKDYVNSVMEHYVQFYSEIKAEQKAEQKNLQASRN